MDTAIFLVDPSPEEAARDSGRFDQRMHLILKTEIKEINLVSRRNPQAESSFLDRIPEKIFEKKGLLNKIKPEKVQKKHIHVDHFELANLLNRLGKESKKEIFIYFEDEP
ncbi:MAG: hypothetical protein HY099_01010, partial [Nitrospirae bacterium]|nr:hypothetical protein [Nitrospirota bacterium]